MSRGRDPAGIDLGQAAEERQPREHVAQLVGLQQLQLHPVPPLRPIHSERGVHEVAVRCALVGGESDTAPVEKQEDISMLGEDRSERRGLALGLNEASGYLAVSAAAAGTEPRTV